MGIFDCLEGLSKCDWVTAGSEHSNGFTQDEALEGAGWVTGLVVEVLKFVGGLEIGCNVEDARLCKPMPFVDGEVKKSYG